MTSGQRKAAELNATFPADERRSKCSDILTSGKEKHKRREETCREYTAIKNILNSKIRNIYSKDQFWS